MVIGSNHYHSEFGRNAVDVSVFQSPKHMLGPVATDGQVDRIPLAIVVIPDRLSLFDPPVSDGITDHEKVDIAFLNAFVKCLVPFIPGGLVPTGFGARGDESIAVRDRHSPRRDANAIVGDGRGDVVEL